MPDFSPLARGHVAPKKQTKRCIAGAAFPSRLQQPIAPPDSRKIATPRSQSIEVTLTN